jgi:hypothetical protein
MKVLIGVDPHKASVAVAAVDESAAPPFREARRPSGRAYPSAQPPPRTPAGPRSWRGAEDTLDPPSCPHPARHTAARSLGQRSPSIGF